jgi:hypothetical protein
MRWRRAEQLPDGYPRPASRRLTAAAGELDPSVRQPPTCDSAARRRTPSRSHCRRGYERSVLYLRVSHDDSAVEAITAFRANLAVAPRFIHKFVDDLRGRRWRRTCNEIRRETVRRRPPFPPPKLPQTYLLDLFAPEPSSPRTCGVSLCPYAIRHTGIGAEWCIRVRSTNDRVLWVDSGGPPWR